MIGVVAHPARRGTRQVVECIRAASSSVTTTSAEVVVTYTTPAHPGGEQATRLLDAGARRLVVVGGDGTVAQCAHALIEWIDEHKPAEPPRLVPIPVGTANLFWRNLVATFPPGPVDVDVAHVTLEPSGLTTTSLVAVGAGNSVRAIQRTPAQHHWWSYIAAGVNLWSWKGNPWTQEVGNVAGVPHRVRIFDAGLDSGSVCYTRFAPRSLVDWVVAGAWAVGAHVKPAAIRTHTGRSFVLDAPHGIHVDGEVYTKVRRARVQVRPRALPVLITPA